jgi:thiosulfate/3-mercaptopyruvate sulfurtransferase
MTFTTLISTDELEQRLRDPQVVLLDARFSLDDEAWGTSDYVEAHIPGALRADLSDHLSGPVIDGVTGRRPFPAPDVFAGQLSAWGIDSTTQVVVYDADRGLMAAARVWVMLRWLGHEAVAVLDGGLTAWLAEGRPMTADTEHATPRTFVPQVREGMLASIEEVDVARVDPACRVFDSRSADGYHGLGKYYDPVKGHIAGAGLAERTQVLSHDGRFLPPADLKAHFEGLISQTPPEQVIFYCGSGVTAAENLLAMAHAGLGDARMYVGSWSEWILDPERPIEL